ncbi:MAG: methyltransferase domain-containing protein, partial [Bacillota bacterium]|nr:methyltransferase domain-containing protein [Bacillota bacterium]
LAANVVHLLPEPERAIAEMKRVCRDGGRLIIPTYIGASEKRKKLNAFSRLVGKMGAGFQRQFTRDTYRSFFDEMGFEHVEYFVVEGKLPCAVAIILNRKDAGCRDTA